jgi:hypothetical protein
MNGGCHWSLHRARQQIAAWDEKAELRAQVTRHWFRASGHKNVTVEA